MRYEGRFENGYVFETNADGDPMVFELGAGRVIQGWDQGILGMQVGGKRKLIIPPELAYGARGFQDIVPPDKTLIFEIDLERVKQP